jgi:tetratricopeptide (TPR) repeat protein
VFGEWNEVEESPAPAPSVSAGRGLFEAQPAPPFADFDWKATVIQPEEEEEEEVYEEPELEGEETPLALVEEAPIGSLDEALQEADFYLKLGFREEAKKLLERLLHDYPRDDRVRRRAEKVMIIPPELLEVEPAPIEPQPEAVAVAEEAETGPGFDLEIDSALDTLFTGEGLDEEPGEVLRYDVAASTSADEAGSPKVHYDLGLAYKEMGLLEDAIQEFQSAVQMLDDPASNPQKILCCSMLANSYLQLGRFTDAIRCAEEGLLIPGQKEFEWKALKYELSSAYEKRGDYAQALAGFNDILERDPEYRDVRARLTQLQRLHGQ